MKIIVSPSLTPTCIRLIDPSIHVRHRGADIHTMHDEERRKAPEKYHTDAHRLLRLSADHHAILLFQGQGQRKANQAFPCHQPNYYDAIHPR